MKEEAQDEHTKNMLCFSKLYSQIDGITVCFWLVFFRPEQAFTRGWKVQMSIMLKRMEHEGWGMRLSACCVGARIRTDGANPCEKEAQVSWGFRTVAEKDTGSYKGVMGCARYKLDTKNQLGAFPMAMLFSS